MALGYTQIPGVDYTKNYVPVISDVTFRTLLALWLVNQWDSNIVDIETVFLHGILEEEVYMTRPEGVELCVNGYDNCNAVKLQHAIYGLVQSARAWWRMLTNFLKGLGFMLSEADPCLFRKSDKFGFVMFSIYVNDALLIGDRKAIDEAK